jgi:hypothetical protein
MSSYLPLSSGSDERSDSRDSSGGELAEERRKQTSLKKALQSHDRHMANDSDSSNTSEDDSQDIDSSSGDSMDDGSDPTIKQRLRIPQKSDFRLEGALNESDLNQENSNSANENSAENNLENYEVDMDQEEDMMGYGYDEMGEEDEEMMMNDDDFERYRDMYDDQKKYRKMQQNRKKSKTQSLQTFLDEHPDSDDDEDMQVMDSDDQDDDEMLMERGDSDDEDEMNDSYAKYLKLNYRDKVFQMQPPRRRR